MKHQGTQPAFQLKGSVLTLSVLQVLTLDYPALQKQLEEMVKKTPNFFQNMPVIIDLQKIYSLDYDIDFQQIHSLLRQFGLVPIGITHGNPKQTAAAIEMGLGVLPNTKTTPLPKIAKKSESSKIITQPIRSGQQIYAQNCDLIILASVSNGAEILADGSIHVYGALRGRAIAGAKGDRGARIFCHKLDAELISIAGHYKLKEELSETESAMSTQAFLNNDELVITSIY